MLHGIYVAIAKVTIGWALKTLLDEIVPSQDTFVNNLLEEESDFWPEVGVPDSLP